MTIQHPNLFQKFGAPTCPISYGPITEPVFTTCNEALTRAQLIDRIILAIFEQKIPPWYTERGIQFEAAMEALHIPHDIRAKIGPQASLSQRLLTDDGYFNPAGLHLFEKEEIVRWIQDRATCPQCTRNSNIAVSKTFYRYISGRFPNSEIGSIQTRVRRTHLRQEIVTRIETIFRNYLIPSAIHTINAYYFLTAFDTIFRTNLVPKMKIALTIHNILIKFVDHFNGPFVFPIYQRFGVMSLLSHYRMYRELLSTHFNEIPALLPRKVILGFAIYYAALKISNYLQLNNRVIQVHRTASHYISDLVSKIDHFIQPYFTRWGLLVFGYYLCTLFYYWTLASLSVWIFNTTVPSPLRKGIAISEKTLKFIAKYTLAWESIKSLAYTLTAGELRPFLVNPLMNYIRLLDILDYVIGNYTTLFRAYSFYATYRDLSRFLNIPNVGRYIPYLKNYIDHPLANI